MIPIFSIGPITFYFFGLMIAIGALTGLYFLTTEAKRQGLNHEALMEIAVYSVIGGILGARIVYILVYDPSYYLANPMKVFAISEGGLSIHGGILGGVLVGLWLLRRRGIPIWQTLDIVAPAIILAQGISRIGCDVFGGPISRSLPWGVEVNGEYLHPAQAYEFLLDYLMFGYLWLRLRKPAYRGQVFIHYLIGYMIIRGIVEFTRVNPIVFGPFSVSHVLSLIGILFGIVLIWFRRKSPAVNEGVVLKKSDYVKTSLTVLILMIISLVIYYTIRG